MRFSFRLQSLLNWKESLEKESRMNLARKNYQLRRQVEEIQEWTEQRGESDRRLRKKMEKGLLAWEYFVYKQRNEEGYQTFLQMKLNKKETEQEIQKERERFTGLMKERKILEKLKEKRFRSYRNEQEKLEQKGLDETAIGAHCREIVKLR